MSKTFRMPEGVNPVRVSINNQGEQFFEAGKVYTVDDDVYALIESNLRVLPKESEEVQPVLPGATPADAGKCAIVGEDGRYTLGLPEGLDELAEDVEEAKAAAESAESEAKSAKTAAQTAQGKAEDAQTAAEGAAAAAEAAAASLDADVLAHIDGYYVDMGVGAADQVASTVMINDKIPYSFRTTAGGADVGNRKTGKIVGGTVAFNQSAPLTASLWSKTNVNVSVTDQTIAIKYSSGGAARYAYITPTAGHVYFASGYVRTEEGKSHTSYFGFINDATQVKTISNSGSEDKTVEKYGEIVYKTASGDLFALRQANSTNAYSYYRNIMLIDLTLTFGSAIAEHILSLQTATQGDGAAFFRKLFPKSYYAYDAGTLMSVKSSANVTVGFNAYDHTAGKAKVVGGMVYQITGSYTALSLDGVTVTPDSDGYFTPAHSGELTVTGGSASDTCVHTVWDHERDGEYEAFEKRTYALDSDLELRGIPKLDANNALYYDGDTYESDGTVTRYYEYRAYESGDESLTDAITDGSHTVVKLVTPTTEEADPYTVPMVVDDWGTEEFVDARDVPIPVGHDTDYMSNLRAKLEMAPKSPNGNGDYIVRQTDGVNAYVAYDGDGRLDALETKVPDAPATDGTYVLKVTVSDGTATYAWVEES